MPSRRSELSTSHLAEKETVDHEWTVWIDDDLSGARVGDCLTGHSDARHRRPRGGGAPQQIAGRAAPYRMTQNDGSDRFARSS